MYYCCGVCGKKHTTEEQAFECEKVHAEEKAKKEELTRQKEAREKTLQTKADDISKEIMEFKRDYNTFPRITFSWDTNIKNVHSLNSFWYDFWRSLDNF